MADLEPIYSAKAKKIIEMLKYQTREEAAKELNYKTWKSLDMYMRRKNFVYDGKQGNIFQGRIGIGKRGIPIGVMLRKRRQELLMLLMERTQILKKLQ